MKNYMVGLGSFLVILSAAVYGELDIRSDNVNGLVDIYDNVNRICQEFLEKDFKERGFTREYFEKALIHADAQIRDSMVQLLTETGDLKAVMACTDEIIWWKEFPKGSFKTNNSAFNYGDALKDKRLRINYMSWPGSHGETFYLLQNSFWNVRKMGIRIVPSTYTIVLNGTDISISDLTIKTTPSLMGTEVPYPLGTVKWQNGQVDVLVLRGPSGSGSFFKCILYSYNAPLREWEYTGTIEDNSRFIDCCYDEESGVVNSKWFMGVSTIVEETSVQLCGEGSSLQMEISTRKEEKYNSDSAPIDIEFLNTGSETVEFGSVRDKGKKGYIGSFYVYLYRKDGTRVFKVTNLTPSEGMESEAFKIQPNGKAVFHLDIAKLYNITKLKPGKYDLYIIFSSAYPAASPYFSGLFKSNIIDLTIEDN